MGGATAKVKGKLMHVINEIILYWKNKLSVDPCNQRHKTTIEQISKPAKACLFVITGAKVYVVFINANFCAYCH